ncbi:MAG: transporter substrate-binding domain-containing protein [Chlamydiales bacterium]|nr:transporter substrate-binding domain-containing protein [Chlamydiales bacterium]
MKRILLCLLVFFVSCGTTKPKLGPYSIGRDPTWFPLELGEMAVNITGFTNALVQELRRAEGKNFRVVDIGWIQLFQGLEEEDYAGVFTSLDPNPITENSYSFSDPFLYLGPVLVLPVDSDLQSLLDLEGTIVGAYKYDESILILQSYPSILIETYQQFTDALQAIVDGRLEGALVPNLVAGSLIPALFADRLKIATEPLSNKGLRLVTLKNKHIELIESFNRGLEKFREDGTYIELRNKFGVK